MALCVVLGGGVSGLSSAVSLLEAGWRVRVFAETAQSSADLPAELVSAGAGGIWEFPPYQVEPAAKARAWALRTLPRLQRLAKRKETGITERRIYMMYRKPGSSYDELAGLPGFRREATVAQVSQAFRGGASYLAPQAFMPQYLCWLQQEVFRLGGTIHVGDDYKVKDLSAASIRQLDGAMPKLLVNCLGLASREVVPDEAMLPIRGGLVYVHCPEVEDVFFDEDDPDGEATYVIPQRNGLVACGGLVQRNREAAALSEAEAAGILGRCERLLPALRGQKVLGTWTGLRPARRAEAGGIRLELELADLPVIHNYGHGGSGLICSWGCALEVADLARNFARENQIPLPGARL